MAWPDAVGLVINYLVPILDPVPVISRVPQDSAPRPPFHQVRRVGGPAFPPVRDVARLDFFSWHDTDPEAMTLALETRKAVWALSGTTLLGVTCYRVAEFMGPRQSDDPVSGTPRVWATYELTLRADDAINPAPPAS